jgi:hypothetical protein
MLARVYSILLQRRWGLPRNLSEFKKSSVLHKTISQSVPLGFRLHSATRLDDTSLAIKFDDGAFPMLRGDAGATKRWPCSVSTLAPLARRERCRCDHGTFGSSIAIGI